MQREDNMKSLAYQQNEELKKVCHLKNIYFVECMFKNSLQITLYE